MRYIISGFVLLLYLNVVPSYSDSVYVDSVKASSDNFSELSEIIVNEGRTAGYTASTKTIQSDEFLGKYQDLSSLLNTVSGVTVHRTGGLGAYSTVQIRGCAANQVQIYLDGIPLNTANGGAVDIGKIPLGSLQ